MDISGRGFGGKSQPRRQSHERPRELQCSTSWEVTQKLKGCLRVIDNCSGMVRRGNGCDDDTALESGGGGFDGGAAETGSQQPGLPGVVRNVRFDGSLTSRDGGAEGEEMQQDVSC